MILSRKSNTKKISFPQPHMNDDEKRRWDIRLQKSLRANSKITSN